MCETMEVYPFIWLYYFNFIFLTAFAFFNVVIGTLEVEHHKAEIEEARASGEPTLKELQDQIQEIKDLIKSQSENFQCWFEGDTPSV